MNFDPSTGSLVEFVVDNNKCMLHCPKLDKYISMDNAESEVLYESLPASINLLSVFENTIKHAIYDYASPRIREPCPKCKTQIVKYVTIQLNRIYICPNCKNTWHY